MSERTTIPGVRVGHWTDGDALTGCTVVLLPPGSRASYELRGGAPAERELAPLEPEKSVDQVDAVVLTGGSVFGLAAADGVVRALAQQGRGVATPAGPVPIVPTLGLFDLAVGEPVAPTATSGRAAVEAAADRFAVGAVGAGTGARYGKWVGRLDVGGVRHGERRLGDVVVGALVAVNAAGSVVGPDDDADAAPLAAHASVFGFRAGDPAGDLTGPGAASGAEPAVPHDDPALVVTDRGQTTIGVVWTNARLDKVGCRIVAQGAHDGLARAITPPHTRTDGDGFVACSVGGEQVDAPVDVVRLLALGAVTDAIRSARADA